MQAQADQHQQQGKTDGGADYVFLAGGKAKARAGAERHHVDRAGVMDVAKAKAAMEMIKLIAVPLVMPSDDGFTVKG